MEANDIRAALDSTVASLLGGVQRLGIEAALPVTEGWVPPGTPSSRP